MGKIMTGRTVNATVNSENAKHAKTKTGIHHAKRSRRSVRMLALTVIITMLTMICLSGFTGAGRGAESSPVSVSPSRYYRIVSVRANDTLWDIALRACEDSESKMPVPVKDVVEEIMQVNSMRSTRIYVGQQLAVPLL